MSLLPRGLHVGLLPIPLLLLQNFIPRLDMFPWFLQDTTLTEPRAFTHDLDPVMQTPSNI
jgi:hypothetical protein